MKNSLSKKLPLLGMRLFISGNNIMQEGLFMKQQSYARKANRRLLFKKIKVFWQKQGFYIVLFLCVCAMGTALFFASGDQLKMNPKESEDNQRMNQVNASDDLIVADQTKQSEYIENRDKDIPGGIYYLDDSEESQSIDRNAFNEKGQVNESAKDNIKNNSVNNENIELTKAVVAEMGDISFPVINGEIYKAYAAEQLVYSETLKEFRTHPGVDILGELGSNVLAFLPGTVEAIEKDELWGVVVVIDHGKGLKSIYANLEDSVSLEKGRYVLSGDVIGTIGQTASIESVDPPHLHFEIKANKKNIDPAQYIDE